jgi:hypothetical protein
MYTRREVLKTIGFGIATAALGKFAVAEEIPKSKVTVIIVEDDGYQFAIKTTWITPRSLHECVEHVQKHKRAIQAEIIVGRSKYYMKRQINGEWLVSHREVEPDEFLSQLTNL